MKKLNMKGLKYLPFVIILVLDIVLSASFNNVLSKEVNYGMPNRSLQTEFTTPTYTVQVENIEPAQTIEVAPINDKEDSQNRTRDVDNTSPSTVNDAKQYETSGTSVGIDVSKWQGNINWTKVKQSGVEFAMIRVGYRGSSTGKIVMDPYFTKNVQGALANNIHVGIYFFSMARTEAEAIEEADWVINAIKRYHVTYPVAFDLESFGQDRLAGVSNEQLNKNAVAFLNRIQSAGYTPMHYGSKSKFGAIWNMNILNKYKIWLAHYTDKTNYAGKYNMWQYTSKGQVPGINGNVDLNIAYFKLSTNASDQALNDSEVSLDPNAEAIKKVNFTDVNEEVITVTSADFRKSPTTELDNKISTISSEVKLIKTGTSSIWSRVTYQNQVGYILNEQLKTYEEPLPPADQTPQTDQTPAKENTD